MKRFRAMGRYWLWLTNADVRRALRGREARFWARRRFADRVRFRVLRRRFSTATDIKESRQSARLVTALARQIAPALILAAAIVAVCELLAASSRLPNAPSWLQPLLSELEPETYDGFINTAAQVGATLLALYFTTVGVVASTAYARGPHRIRVLFVREKSGRFYTRCVALLVTTSLIVVAVRQLGYDVHALTICAIVLLAMFSVLSLVVLGVTIFNFFDPSSLAAPLVNDFQRWGSAASRGDRVAADASFQAHFQLQGAIAIQSLGELLNLVQATDKPDPDRVASLGRDAAHLLQSNAYLKTAVPTTSHWYQRALHHPSWLTASDHERSVAIETMTALRPTEVPDHAWVETALTDVLIRAIETLVANGELRQAVGLMGSVCGPLHTMGSLLQVPEALEVCRAVAAPAWEVAENNEVGELERCAMVDAVVLCFISVGLGFQARLKELSPDRLRSDLDKAIRRQGGIYRIGVPVALLHELEEIERGLEFELAVEERHVTPPWFPLQITARHLAVLIRKDFDAIVDELSAISERAANLANDGQIAVAAATAFRAMEMLNKSDGQATRTARYLVDLQAVRRVPDEYWPAPPGDEWPELLPQLESDLVNLVAQLLLPLAGLRRADRDPDWFGQSYSMIVSRLYEAMERGDEDFFAAVFPQLFAAAFHARDRLVAELADRPPQTLIAFISEPLTDLLELSGYALLFTELSRKRFWDTCRTTWDSLLDDPQHGHLVNAFGAVLTAREGIFAIKPRDIERGGRKQSFDHLLRSQGITDHRWEKPFWSDQESTPAHPSAIIRAFAPYDLGGLESPEDLFVVEYLSLRPEWQSELSHRAASLQDQLRRAREEE